jgi:hypothetical protein
MKKVVFLTLLSLMTLSSCVNKVSKDSGTLDLTIAGLNEYVVVETKSAVDYTDVNNYDVVIDGPTKYEAKFSQMRGEVVELGSGSYTITVTSPSTEPAAFEQPIYQAYESFVIKAGEVTPLDLVCTPKNCKVTIELSENFVKELATYEVVVSNGLGELTWIKNTERNDFSEGKAGYFLPRGLEIKVKGYRSIDNTEATAVHFVADPQPAEHHIVKLDAKVTGQIGGITIDVNTDFNDREQNVDIPGLDEEYVDRPDFGDGDEGEDEEVTTAPTIEWEANRMFDPISIAPDSQISMVINAQEGIKTFRVEVSDNFKDAIKVVTNATEGFSGQNIDYIDLVNHSAIWSKFNLPVGDAVANQTSITFELTPFVATLCSAAAGMTVSFTLYCTDNKDQALMVDLEDGNGLVEPTVTLNVPSAN